MAKYLASRGGVEAENSCWQSILCPVYHMVRQETSFFLSTNKDSFNIGMSVKRQVREKYMQEVIIS